MTGRAARLRAASGALDRDQRFAALAAASLLVTMFLPWYEKSVFIVSTGKPGHDSISAFGAVSFVEAAIFLVSAGVLVLVLARAEGGRFHLPGGDGTVIFAGGLWASALIFYRVFDRPAVNGDGAGASVGIQWGFFVAFVAAGALAVAGQRMRVASRAKSPVRERRRSSAPDAPAPQVPPEAGSQEDARGAPSSEAQTQVVPFSEARTEVASSDPRPPPDRAVRRSDAKLTVDDPPDPPTRPGRTRRPRNLG